MLANPAQVRNFAVQKRRNQMAEVIRMPRMSDTMTEGVFVEWHKKVGDKVKSGDVLAEVETDKATMELESYNNGVLLYIGVEAGKAAPVDSVIAIIGKEGEAFQELLDAAQKEAPAAEKSAEEPVKEEPKKETPAPRPEPVQETITFQENGDGRVKASPLAKKMAAEKGIALTQVSGSGDGGRIVRRDIENFVPGTETSEVAPVINIPAYIGEESFEEVAVSQMRKTIAGRLSQSKFTAPHFYLTISVDMSNAMDARKRMNENSPVKISFNDIIVKASALALRRHPGVNSSWLGDKIRINHHVHIGVAVAINDGLVVPVIRFADGKSLSAISAETGDLAKRARDRKLQPQDWEGNTFTISNLGMMGIEEFTAIINPPDACILAVGGISEVPVVKNGQIVPGHVMKMTMSCDHRVVDGATGAAFLQTLKGFLENPVSMLV
ncbi:MAG: pyruvate dehydrogenase complex dihydrolipoamide acetyltransferase [Chitinophagales bacterium]|nr:pyruvate dehydrogenase complex dihydrolipoamide acetyltransferase [Chitinophagales bacterium]MCB9020841.1 pyruvate dehydrogenase complex dihydrolipoamide acetyltransferase [Chitinophagales bacterium]MCB9031241.1 pyruvate dehydrogenase complex dihydrolipoamide acetyltransferase [Chitinophagales bacterium]HAE14835.1 pyruvate dehydrogenase complex dihydrolipoamide acetyltransferase [Bacteroidota bacterium]HAE35255.1 pyruvate dehydrogenase complex dihydrolipoamide acetyltransferase [Bacteroidota